MKKCVDCEEEAGPYDDHSEDDSRDTIHDSELAKKLEDEHRLNEKEK
jgi:hypothetical protein